MADGWGQGFSCGAYGDPVLRRLLHLYKYSQVDEAGEVLFRLAGASVGRQVETVLSGLENPLLVPVPLHPVNRAWRGFNQAECLAEYLAVELEEECRPQVLVRRFSFLSQAKLPVGSHRLDNVQEVFRAGSETADLLGRDVLLIDDVCTTGATLRECAVVLRELGAVRVSALTLLRGG